MELDVVFARPNPLHGSAHLFRQNRSFSNVIRLRLAPESSAEKSYMADYVFFRDSQLSRNDVLHSLRILRRGPQYRFAVLEFREGNQRLHRGVRKKRNVVVRLIYLVGFGKRRIRVTDIAHHFAWIVRGCSQFDFVRVRIVSFVWSVNPSDVQLLAALKRSPGVIRNNRDAAKGLKRRGRLEGINWNSLTYACDLQGFLIVVRLHFAAKN